ncbi:unnamed protein product, partial [Ectocarpus sp. 12 AP-2014]
EVDGSITNEIQDLANVLGEGADAGGTVVTNLGTPVAGTDATTKDYVDTELSNLDTDDADANPSNEFNTGSGITAGSVEITDGGGTESVNLISTDGSNDIGFGSDGALYLNVSSVTISETITTLTDNGDGSFTYENENGAPVSFEASSITDNGDGTSNV